MSKERIRRLETFSFYDHTGIEKHLAKMAEKGWLLSKIDRFTWEYRRIAPKKLHFAVTFYPKASEFDPEPLEGQMIYQEYSARFGWKFICRSAQMQIFYSEEENPVPLETDPVVEVAVIHQAAKRSFLWTHYVFLALAVLQTALFVSSLLGDPIRLLSSTTQLATGFLWGLLFLFYAIELAGYYRWHHAAVRAAETGEFPDTHHHPLFQKLILLAAAAALLYIIINLFSSGDRLQLVFYLLFFVCITALAITVNGVKQLLKRMKATRTANTAITLTVDIVLAIALVFGMNYSIFRAVGNGLLPADTGADSKTQILHQTDLPLTVEDLLDIRFDGYIKENRQSESIFLGQRSLRQWARHTDTYVPELSYTVTIVKVSGIYPLCKNSLLNKAKDTVDSGGNVFINHYEPTDSAPWLAEEAYQLHWSDSILYQYLLCYEDRIIKIDFDWEPTAEQMQIVGEKLAGISDESAFSE